jgi:nicotinamide-nucleotide amidase
MNAIILSIGDELILGQTVDSNSAWLSQQLAQIGCPVSAHVTVADDQQAIEKAIHASASQCDWLIITGGIGPTPDDLTRQALAAVLNEPLELNESWLTRLRDFFAVRGRPMPEINTIQAMIPRGAKMIDNPAGTAAGIHASLRASVPSCLRASCEIFVLPGVPKEMKTMFQQSVLPAIQPHCGGGVILSRTLHTFGLGESAIAEMLGGLMDRSRNPSVGTTVSNGIVSLRINARFENAARAREELEKTDAACRQVLGELIFGVDDETLPEVIARLLKQEQSEQGQAATKERNRTIATAESCTGGLLAKMLTDIPGSSAYFRYGWVTYANEAKESELGVLEQVLKEHGAVSEPVVRAMAFHAMVRASADFALAISGIAGPDGGTATKPVGTVCIALAYRGFDKSNHEDPLRDDCTSRTFPLFGDREMVRDRAAKMALTMLRFHLLGKPLPF